MTVQASSFFDGFAVPPTRGIDLEAGIDQALQASEDALTASTAAAVSASNAAASASAATGAASTAASTVATARDSALSSIASARSSALGDVAASSAAAASSATSAYGAAVQSNTHAQDALTLAGEALGYANTASAGAASASSSATAASASATTAASSASLASSRATSAASSATSAAASAASAMSFITGSNETGADGFSMFTGKLKIGARSGSNCIIGVADNNTAPGTVAFPTGVTGYGALNSAGGQAFGLFGRADIKTTGTGTNEVNSFNLSGNNPTGALPPDRSFGSSQTVPVALTVAAGGSKPSSIGVHICQEGSAPQTFLTGIYSSPDAVVNYCLFIDATATDGAAAPAVIKSKSRAVALTIQGAGAYEPAYALLTVNKADGTVMSSVKQDGSYSVSGGFAVSKDFISHGATANYSALIHNFYTASGAQFQVYDGGGAANLVQARGAGAGNSPSLTAIGSDTNIDLSLIPKGAGNVKIGGWSVAPTGNITFSTGFGGLYFPGGGVTLLTGNGPQLQVADGGGGANYAQVKGAPSGQPVIYGASGETNVHVKLQAAGTGRVILTGGSVYIDVGSLPTSDPHDAGKLWRSGTALQVSIG